MRYGTSPVEPVGKTNPKHHLTRREAASYLRLSPRTLEGWAVNGTGPRMFRAGGRVLYRLDDLEKFVEAGEVRYPDGEAA